MAYYGFPPYVPVAQRHAQARKNMERMRKQGKNIQPIEIEGRKITQTFWGDAWCNHLEQYSDFSNRLPRGRTYVRNGSVCHLEIDKGRIDAIVSGSSLYEIKVKISPLAASRWKTIKKRCAGQIGSLLELLQGKLSKQVMEIVTDPKNGLFPSHSEIKLDCDCPDWATMCKHISAVLYGIGARLDQQPELLFVLRCVDHNDLIGADVQLPDIQIPKSKGKGKGKGKRRQFSGDLSDVFGIELDESTPLPKTSTTKTLTIKTSSKKKPSTPTKSSSSQRPKSVKANKPKQKMLQKIIRPTGKSVTRLRKRFSMNLSQFACLIGVSAKTISNWENQLERLKLRPENLEALARVNKLDKTQAWRRL